MNWAWASSLDQIWRSPDLPMWLAMAAAGFFGLVILITLLRAEKSVANGALAVITLLAIGVASAATFRGFGMDGRGAPAETHPVQQVTAVLPQLSCIDDLAGDAVLVACEKVLFGSAESTAAAVAYAASRITQLTGFGDVAAANLHENSELLALRRAVERDRYGLMAYVLTARDHCAPSACPAFSSLADNHQVAANMDEHLYENLVARYAPSWNAPAQAPAAAALSAALPASMPTGKPTNAEFPTSASTPAVSIMTPEPPAAAPAPEPKPPVAAAAPVPAPRPASAKPSTSVRRQAPRRASAPVQIAPVPRAPAHTPTAANQ
jgi:hypothetical protein